MLVSTPRAILRLALAALLLAGCGDNNLRNDDTDTSDAADAVDDVTDTIGDVDMGDAVDTTDTVDMPDDVDVVPDLPDDSLEGTSLEGVVVQWDAPLELCVPWFEGRTFDEVKAAKAHIVLPPSHRDMSQTTLGSATLSDVVAARGIHYHERWMVPNPDSQTTEWRLTDPAGNTRLDATIVHDLGEGGVLEEVVSVSRARGSDPAPVVWNAKDDFTEVTWHYTPPGWTEAPLLMASCDAPEDWEHAVSTIVAERDGRQVAVTRYWRTLVTFAGSQPVRLEAARLVFSDNPYQTIDVYGPWALTYNAQHHNWADDSELNMLGDINQYHKTWAAGGTALESVRYVPEGIMTGALNLTWLDVASGMSTTERWDVLHEAYRIDEEALSRGVCAGGQVSFVGSTGDFGSGVGFNLVECPPQVGSFNPTAVVVTDMNEALGLVGHQYDGNALTPVTIDGREGVRVQMHDGYTAEITRASDGDVFVYVFDSMGAQVSGFLTEPRSLPWPAPQDEVIEGQSADGEVRLRLVRRWAAQGAGFSSIYSPVSMRIDIGDNDVFYADAYDVMDYTNTHHNWNDQLYAGAGFAQLFWTVSYGPEGLRHVVEILNDQGGEYLAPTDILVP